MTNAVEEGLQGLFGLYPTAQVVAGIALIVGGGLLTAGLWHMGFIAYLTFVLIPTGIALVISGVKGQKKERAAREQWRRVSRNEAQLVDELVEAKGRGERAVDYLRKRGFTDMQVRNHLLRLARDRDA